LAALVVLACRQSQPASEDTRVLLFTLRDCVYGHEKFLEKHLTIRYSKPHLVFQVRMDGEYEIKIDESSRHGNVAGDQISIASSVLKSHLFEETDIEHHPGFHRVSIENDLSNRVAVVELDRHNELAVMFRQLADVLLKRDPLPLPSGYTGSEINTVP
jgi:hypothetical protein